MTSQDHALVMIACWTQLYGHPPAFRELARALGCSIVNVHRLVTGLRRREYLPSVKHASTASLVLTVEGRFRLDEIQPTMNVPVFGMFDDPPCSVMSRCP